jgi:hypothetical protein
VNQYQPRPFRSDLELPIRFFSTDGLASGHCLNISASGMLAKFDKPVAIWLAGELTILLEEQSINIGVRVARVNGRKAGLSFQIEDDKDRLTIDRLMDFVSAHSQPA